MKSVFVSSTFKDMQYERDMIQTLLAPQLNATAVQYGDSVFFSDLRWGISTENFEQETASRKILSVCLDEIDRCRPYMLIFIGERYGWIPDSSLIKRAADEKGFLLDNYDISVTSLEIEFGTLAGAEDYSRCIFCFRKQLPLEAMTTDQKSIFDSEDEVHRNKVNELKAKIRSIPGANIIEYDAEWDEVSGRIKGLEVLSEKLSNEFLSMFSTEWEKEKCNSWQQLEQKKVESFLESKVSSFCIRPDIISGITNNIEKESSPVILKGNPGSGKTTLACQLYSQLIGKYVPCLVLCGNSEHMLDVTDILRFMIYRMETGLGVTLENDRNSETNTFSYYKRRFRELCELAEKESDKHFIFIIDAPDQLLCDSDTAFIWMPEVQYDNVHFVISTLESYKLPSYIESNAKIMHLEKLEGDSKYKVIKAILDNEHKELSQRVYDAMMLNADSDNPLYLSLLLRRLIMFDNEDFSEINSLGGDIDAITRHMIDIIDSCPQNIDEMCRCVAEEAGLRINKELSSEALGLIAASRFGLRETDISRIFENDNIKWNALDFSRLIKYLKPFLIFRTDGRIDFNHKSLRSGISHKGERALEYDKKIYDHLLSLNKNDTVRQSEIIYHMYRVDDKNMLTDYLWDAGAMDASVERESTELRNICIENGPEWLNSVITSEYSIKRGSWFYSFFSTVFINEFRPTYLEQNCLLSILLAVFSVSDKISGLFSNEVRGTIEYQIARIYEDTVEDNLKAEKHYLNAYELLKVSGNWKIDIPARVNLGITCNTLASFAADKSDYKTAEKFLEETDRILSDPEGGIADNTDVRKLIAENELTYANTMVAANMLSEAEKHLSEARNKYAASAYVDADKSNFDIRANHCLSRIYILKGDYAGALKTLEDEVDKRRERHEGLRTLKTREMLMNSLLDMGRIYSLTSQSDRAIEVANEALEQARLLNSEIDTASSARNLVSALRQASSYLKATDEALASKYSDEAVELAYDILAKYENNTSRCSVAEALRQKASLEEDRQRWSEAMSAAKASADMLRDVADDEKDAGYESKILYTEHIYLRSLFSEEKIQEALELYRSMLKRAREQMLVYPGAFSLNIYDETVHIPLVVRLSDSHLESLENILNDEIAAAEQTDVSDEFTAIQVVGECQGSCYETLARIETIRKNDIMAEGYFSIAVKYYKETYEETQNSFFLEKMNSTYSLLANKYRIENNWPMADFYQAEYLKYLIECAEKIDTYASRVERIKAISVYADIQKNLKKMQDAIKYANVAISMYEQLPKEYASDQDVRLAYADANEVIGSVCYESELKTQAEPYFRLNCEIREKILQNCRFSSKSEEESFYSNYATSCFLVGAVADKSVRREYFVKGKKILEEVLKNDPGNKVYLNNYEWVLNVLNNI